MIKEFSASASNSKVVGGMEWDKPNGKLTVPMTGRYVIYAQIHFKDNGPILVLANGQTVAEIIPRVGATDEGTLYTRTEVELKGGQAIELKAGPSGRGTVKLIMQPFHTFFGARLI